MRKDLALELRGDPRTMGGPSSPGFSGTFCRPGASSPVLRGSLPIPQMDGWIHPQCLTLQTARGVWGCRWGVGLSLRVLRARWPLSWGWLGTGRWKRRVLYHVCTNAKNKRKQ